MKNRPLFRPLALLILIVLITGIVGVLIRNGKESLVRQTPVSDGTTKSFAQFDQWKDEFSSAAPAGRAPLIAEGLQLARARRAVMEKLIESNPQQALEDSVSLDVWKRLPQEIQAEVEEPFSALGHFRVLPVCTTGTSESRNTEAPDVVRYTEIQDQPVLSSYVFGRRIGLSTKENSPIQGIRLGRKAALRQEVFHPLKPQEVAIAKSIYPLANPFPDLDFSTGERLGDHPVSALSGGKIFEFQNDESLKAFNESIEKLDEKPGPHTGAAVLFLPAPAPGTEGAFDLTGTTARNNTLASAWTETKKKVFMIRCDFSDYSDSSHPVVIASDYNSVLNTTVSDDIRNFSYGKTWIEATVASTITRLPQGAAYYSAVDDQNTSRNSQLLADAKSVYQTANPSINYFDYDIVGVWFGGINMRSEGVHYAGLAGGSQLWIQNSTDVSVHVHEFGHNYGIGHSSFWTPPTGSTNPVDPAGTYDEYGDPFDVMGSGPVPEGVYHSEAKQRLNWLGAGEWTDATAVGSGTYRINRIDNANTTGVRGLRITKGASEYYWLSYRKLFANSWLKAGANIVWQRAGWDRSWLIDTTPGSLAGSSDRTDGSIAIGRTFSAPGSNIYITPLARGGTSPNEYLDVAVNFGTFPGNNPPVVNLTGPSTIPARQTVIFTANATDPNGDTLAYSWDFGQGFTFDNHNSSAASWSIGGTYTVTVTVSDMKGLTTQATKVVTVTDPVMTWASRTNSSAGNFNTLVASPTKVIAAGDDYASGNGPIATSTNGINWTSYQLEINQHMFGSAWDGSKFLLAGWDATTDWVGCILTSPTGDVGSWTRRVQTGSTLSGIAYGGGVYVAVGDNGTIRRSIDGVNWNLIPPVTSQTLASVSYGGGKFVAVGHNYNSSGDCVVITSADGISWNNTTSGSGLTSQQDLRYVAWANDRFLASGWYGKVRYSLNLGSSFITTRTAREDTPGLAYGNGLWFAAGTAETGSVDESDVDLVSTDGASWTSIPTPSLENRNAAIFFANTFITAGANHTIRQSSAISATAIGYPLWRETYFPDHGNLTAADEDNDGDSMTNLLEYVLGRSPVSVTNGDGVTALPQALITSANPLLSDRLALQFSLPEPTPVDIGYVVESSVGLTGSWSSLATKIGSGAWVWNPGGTSRVVLGSPAGGRVLVTVGDSQATSAAPKRFLRLRSFVNQ